MIVYVKTLQKNQIFSNEAKKNFLKLKKIFVGFIKKLFRIKKITLDTKKIPPTDKKIFPLL